MLKSLTDSPIKQLLKQLFGNFSKQLYSTLMYVPTAIGIGISRKVCATSAVSPHLSTEQFPTGFQFLFLASLIGNSSTEEFMFYPVKQTTSYS